MKVFCFVQLFHISERGGGAEVQANYLATELANRGYEVHYICMSINADKVNTSSVMDGVTIHWLPQKTSDALENFRNIKNRLLQIQPDYIIERMSSAYAWPILKAVKASKAKYIWICTDNESPRYFRTLRNYFKKKSIIKFLYASIKALKIDLIRMYANKRADIVFSQNEIQKELLLKNFKRNSQRMISGHPFPEVDKNTKERFDFQTVLWCANFGSHKRPELFVELARQMQHTNLKFVMVGGHSDTTYVNTLLKDKPKNLTTTGQLSFDEALTHFDKASILVNSSISEGFSNTYIQAWLRGVPVVVFGADPNNVIDKNQLGFDINTVEAAVDKIVAVMSDFESYHTLSENSRTYGSQNHSIEVMTDNFLNSITANENT